MPPVVGRISKAAAPLQPSAGVKVSASQVLASALERGHGRYAVSFGQQRSRAAYPAHRRALCAKGRASNTTALSVFDGLGV